MQYLWEKFNIKTFPARTIVFLDGEFRRDLSDFPEKGIQITGRAGTASIRIQASKKPELPLHIISVGENSGAQTLRISNACVRPTDICPGIFVTAKLTLKKPAFLTFLLENAGKNSKISGDMVFLNESDLKVSIFADHLAEATGIFVKNRVLAGPGSATELSGIAKILGDCPGCESDLSFSALCAPDIKSIKMSPNQKIASVPASAEHSANLWRGTNSQIEYLKTAGLNADAVDALLREAFINN